MSHTLIVGRFGCRKTHYLLNFLKEKCKGKYSYIYIICPTFSTNLTWQNWLCKNDSGVKVLETSDVNRAIKTIVTHHEQGKKL